MRSRGRKPQSFHRSIHSDDINQISIRIPNKFTREYRKNILLNNVLIISSDDKVWFLGWMISGDGKLWLQKGLPEFAKHYCLKSGYLLIFNHHGKSVFHVHIFDRSGCEINYAPTIIQEIDEPATGDDQTMAAMSEREVLYTPSGCLKDVNSPSGNFSSKGDDVDDDDDSLQKVRKLTRVLRKSYLLRLPLSMRLCNATRIGRYGGVRLRNDKGKTWKVKVMKYKSKTSGRKILPHFTRGWSDFRKANEIMIGDICEISHVKGNLLHVHAITKEKSN